MRRLLPALAPALAIALGLALPARAGEVLAPIVSDTWVDAASPAAVNGPFAELFVTKGKSTELRRTLVRADLSGVPKGTVIQSATLRLFVESGAGATLAVHRLLSGFDEATATWATQPSSNAQATGAGSVAGPGWIDLDVTSDVRKMVDGKVANDGWLVRHVVETTPLATVQLWSKDYATDGFEPHVQVVLAGNPIQVGPGLAFESVQDALLAVPSSPVEPITIEVASGLLLAPLLVSIQAPDAFPLTIQGLGPDLPEIEGSGFATIQVSSSKNVTIRGFDVVPSEPGQIGALVFGSEAVTLDGLFVEASDATPAGVVFESTTGSTVSHCRVFGGEVGISLAGAGTKANHVQDNVVLRQLDGGIVIEGGASANTVSHNSLLDAGEQAISLVPHFEAAGAGPDNVVAQNLVRTSGVAIAWVADPLGLPPPGTVVDRNALDLGPGGVAALADGFGAWLTSADLHAGTGLGAHHVEGDLLLADPGAIDPEDVRLEPWTIEAGYPVDSPAVDAGVAVWASAVAMDGVLRPQGPAPDAGAFEQARTARSPSFADALRAEVVSEPVLAGEPLDLLVEAANEAGGQAFLYDGIVVVTVEGSGEEVASFDFSPGDQGIHLFEDVVSFDAPGEYALRVEDADDPSLVAVVSHVTVVSEPTQQCLVRRDGLGDSETIAGCASVFSPDDGGDLLVEVADDGSYREGISSKLFPLAVGSKLTVRAQAGSRPVLAGTTNGQVAMKLSHAGTRVEGFRCRSLASISCFQVAAPGSEVVSNLVYGDADVVSSGGIGIAVTSNGCLVSGNVVLGHHTGIALLGNVAKENAVAHNVVTGNSFSGVKLHGAGESNLVLFNTLYDNGEAELLVEDSETEPTLAGQTFAQNVVVMWSKGAVVSIQTKAGVPEGFTSDWNDLWGLDGTFRARLLGEIHDSLAAWQAATGLDPKSFSLDPLFVEPGQDFHLRSTAGHFAPGLPPSEWPKDAETSPCIDAADPLLPVGDEPEPNGGRAELGAYGQTPQASLSP